VKIWQGGTWKIFSTARGRDEKNFFAQAARNNRNEFRYSRASGSLYRHAFPLRGQHPFDTAASTRKIVDSDDRLVLSYRKTARRESIGWKCG
jgi:hypothetical protein